MKIPTWIVIAIIYAVLGIAISIAVYTDPHFNELLFDEGRESTEGLISTTNSWVIRNTVTAIVLLVAVFIRTPSALFAGFFGRVLTKLLDGIQAFWENLDWGILNFLAFSLPAFIALWKLLPKVKEVRDSAKHRR